jgi:hypothetical protein
MRIIETDTSFFIHTDRGTWVNRKKAASAPLSEYEITINRLCSELRFVQALLVDVDKVIDGRVHTDSETEALRLISNILGGVCYD